VVLELRCIKCNVGFKKTIEGRRKTSNYNEGEMVRYSNECPNKCGGEWFTVEKLHPIRKFKKRD